MRKYVILSISILLMLSPMFLCGQSRIALKGSNSPYMVSDNNRTWGLEIGGNLVVNKVYSNFETSDGNYFSVTATNGLQGICDASGNFIYPCEYLDASIVSGTIVLQKSADAEPKFYSTKSPTQEVQAKQMTVGQLRDEIAARAKPGTYFDPERMTQKKAARVSKELSTQTGAMGSYMIRDTPGGRQELIVDGQVLFTANTFDNITTPDSWQERGHTWYFIVNDKPKGRSAYGVFCIWKYIRNDSLKVGSKMLLPYEYDFIAQHSRNRVRCSLFNFGGTKYYTLGNATPPSPNKVYKIDKTIEIPRMGGAIKLESVAIHDNYVELQMEYFQNINRGDIYFGAPGEKGAYKIVIGDQVFPLISAEGIIYSNEYGFDNRTQVTSGNSLRFDMRFKKLPEGIVKFDLIKGEGGEWDMKDISLK